MNTDIKYNHDASQPTLIDKTALSSWCHGQQIKINGMDIITKLNSIMRGELDSMLSLAIQQMIKNDKKILDIDCIINK